MTADNPGYKTTEFWITAVTYVINLLNLTGAWNFVTNWHSGILMVVSAAAYKVARGLAKNGVLRAPVAPTRAP
jgi:hypothetical protein